MELEEESLMILAGDIGGTKTLLAWVEESGGELCLRRLESYPSSRFGSLGEILELFLSVPSPAPLERAALGIAGPVVNGRCEATNLPWVVDAGETARRLSLPSVELINDLEAAAWGILRLGKKEREVLQSGLARPGGAIAVIAAGTGLGEGGLVWDGRRYFPLPSEGGHVDFAPRNDLEADLLRFLAARHGRVSYERVLSGPGLHALYQFLRSRSGRPEPEDLKSEMAAGDPPAVITRRASEGSDSLCSEALRLFVSLYGAEAGNLALKLLSTGGVYVAGGIAPRILAHMRNGPFMESFLDKGRFRPLLAAMPVCVVTHPHVAILGAAHRALSGSL
ncbi:MAG: glucokinase [Bacteroidota bacterium]